MNRLAQETSPYLLQHKENPVDWYPWGNEALERSRAENKPILLSVGYSACHWCHVMAHECFENPEIAALMNEHFVNIKVDREERPDLDQVYQNVAQAMTRGGGWPLTVFLTPELKPFYGGTYFPPQEKYGRPDFGRLLVALSQAYQAKDPDVLHNVERLMEVISRMEKIERPDGPLPLVLETQESGTSALVQCLKTILDNLDYQLGGMAGAPKFPQTSQLTFVWRMSLRLWDREPGLARRAAGWVNRSLEEMARGGIFDQIGGGFSRYSVDEEWTVPHFEKMLYDNALLLALYSEVLLNSGAQGLGLSQPLRALYLDVVQKTVSWLDREMTADNGLFFSALDADSLDDTGHSHEGHFYVWQLEQLEGVLDSEEFEFAKQFYSVRDVGNFEGATILTARTDMDLDAHGLRKIEERVRAKLLNERAKRARPGLDDKVLVGWNGLMISGLVWAGRALTQDGRVDPGKNALKMAQKCWDSVLKLGLNFEGVNHSLCATIQFRGEKSEAKFKAYLDDYAFMIQAGLDLARISQDQSWIREVYAQLGHWTVLVDESFKDKVNGFYFSAEAGGDLIQRPKRITDQAIPCGGAVYFRALLVFGGREGLVKNELQNLWPEILRSPGFHAELLNTTLLLLEEPTLIGPVLRPGSFGFEHAFVGPPGVESTTRTQNRSETIICWRGVCRRVVGDGKADWERMKL